MTQNARRLAPVIFISYRINDSKDLVSRLDHDLTEEFGQDLVFRDRTRIPGGANWAKEIEENANNRRIMLVMIGPQWKSVSLPTGDPRLSNPDDWVRKEITIALTTGKIVIPVLLNSTSMPDKEWLAKYNLGSLADLKAVELRTDDYEPDLAKLLKLLRLKVAQTNKLVPSTDLKAVDPGADIVPMGLLRRVPSWHEWLTAHHFEKDLLPLPQAVLARDWHPDCVPVSGGMTW
jgi:hypothetical protein